VLEQGGIELPRFCHLLGGAFEVNGVPERDGSHNQVQPACAMPLILKGSIADFAEPIVRFGRVAHKMAQMLKHLALQNYISLSFRTKDDLGTASRSKEHIRRFMDCSPQGGAHLFAFDRTAILARDTPEEGDTRCIQGTEKACPGELDRLRETSTPKQTGFPEWPGWPSRLAGAFS
jgi:hypothetical protein